MSSFMKTSPQQNTSSSTLGMYGAPSINPYASYFGPQGHQVTSPLQGSSAFGPSGINVPIGPSGHSFMSSPSAAGFNPHSFGAATSPFTSPGQHAVGGGQQYCSPFTAQTRIIGGVHQSPGVVGVGGMPSATSFQQQSPRYYQQSYLHQANSPDLAVEPMHYSPINTSSNYPGQGQSNMGMHNMSPPNSYVLPSYLLGMEQTHHNHSFHHQGGSGGVPPSPGGPGSSSTSGGPSNRGIGPSSFMSPSEGYRRTLLFEPSSFIDSENSAGGDGKASSKSKRSGPPIYGFGSAEGVNSKDFLESELMKDSYTPKLDGTSGMSEIKTKAAPPSVPASASSSWVTIFGFPGGASSFVLTNFSTCGKIMEVKTTPGSNWIHIRFSNKIEARRALSKNGKVLAGSIMVGVVNSDPKVIQEAEISGNGSQAGGSPQMATSPSGPSSILRERNADNNDSIKSRLRPLATGSVAQQSMIQNVTPRALSQMPSSAREAFEVERTPGGTGSLPSASNGVFTKAMEFMFGW